MAAALRSSVGLALRRHAVAPASSPRLSSANTTVRHTRRYGNFDSSRSMFDPEAYGHNTLPPNPELDKFDGLFTVAACLGTLALLALTSADLRRTLLDKCGL